MHISAAIFTLLVAVPNLVSAYGLPIARHAKRNLRPLDARQDNGKSPTISSTSFDLSLTLVQGNTATTLTGSTSSGSGGSNSGTGTGRATGDTATATDSGTQSRVTYASTQTFDARLPAGGVVMITPAPTAQATYYKIKDKVTFAFNFTSLSVTPTAVDILASCTRNQQMYTISANQSVGDGTQQVIWDTGAFQSSAPAPLLTEQYTLYIHDSSKDLTAVAQSGYLATFSNLRFSMYLPQEYVPYEKWKCATCSGATSLMQKQTFSVVIGMAVVCVLSSSWLL